MCMIVPFWPGSVWWPALVRDGGRLFRPFVWACEVLTQQRDLFLGGAHGNTVPQATPQWRSMALLLDFRFPKRTPVSVPLWESIACFSLARRPDRRDRHAAAIWFTRGPTA